MVISTTIAYVLAWINIKRLQIDQHRAWMMRAWSYVRLQIPQSYIGIVANVDLQFATIITIRLIIITTATIVSTM